MGDKDQPPGSFDFYVSSASGGKPAGLLFMCPCGCGQLNSVSFRDTNEGERPSWVWDGDEDKPTLTPSINILQTNDKGERIGEHWHGYLIAGRWRMP